MNDDELRISQSYLSEVAKRYGCAEETINATAKAVPPSVAAGEFSEAIEAIATRLVEAATQLAGVCGTTSENLKSVVASALLDEERIAAAFKNLQI